MQIKNNYDESKDYEIFTDINNLNMTYFITFSSETDKR